MAETITFDTDAPGAAPSGWTAGVTGRGSPRRTVEAEASANALENNVSLYYTQKGRRITIKYMDAPVPANSWHTLRVEITGKQFRAALDGKAYIELDDEHFAGSGRVGVWTKADSVTVFDDFVYASAERK